jgi:molybdopterin-guanine dinucleotide biosynthesis protein A
MTAAIGFVVAGGRSLRMGRDKALLPWAGSTLLDDAVARVRLACPDVRILCGPVPRYADRGVPLVTDRIDGAGPLAGLEAALVAAGDWPVLLLGVDLPFVTAATLAFLLGELEGADAVVPAPEQMPQPLCAAYAPSCLPAVQARLAAGERRMTSFWPDVDVRRLPSSDFKALGDPRDLFRNLNTPEDLHRART